MTLIKSILLFPFRLVGRMLWLVLFPVRWLFNKLFGPPPMTTKVSSALRLSSSVSVSARSRASSTRRRIAVASSMVFTPGAKGAQSSRPK